jgi:hypothetical protein
MIFLEKKACRCLAWHSKPVRHSHDGLNDRACLGGVRMRLHMASCWIVTIRSTLSATQIGGLVVNLVSCAPNSLLPEAGPVNYPRDDGDNASLLAGINAH